MRRLFGIAIAGLLLLGSSQPALADTASDLAAAQVRQATIESVRAQLGSQLATALQTQETISQSLRDNAAQQAHLQAEIDDTNAKIGALEIDIKRLDTEVSSTQVRVDSEKFQIKTLARAIYAQPSSMLLLMIGARSLGEVITRINDLRSAGTRAEKLKSALKDDVARLGTARSKQDSDRAAQVKLREQEAADLTKLRDLQAKQLKAQSELDAQITATRGELLRVDRQSSALAKQIADLLQSQQEQIIAAAEEAVWDQVQTIHPTNLAQSRSSGHSKQFRFVWPLPTSSETQPFGPSQFWFEPPFGTFAHFHTGIDMSAAEGSPVQAADDGVAILAGGSFVNGVLVGYGNYVVIAHVGGLTTLYGHLQRVNVKVGDVIVQGQVIGFEGSTGNSTGAHLHFELRQGNNPIDPAPFLPPGPPSDFRS